MHNVFKGIIVGFIGFVTWLLVSVPLGVGEAVGMARDPILEAFMFLGFTLMVGGPIVYIVFLPVAGWLRNRRARARVRASLPSP